MAEGSGRPLLTAKQVVPPVRAGAVPRERLAEQLREAETRLTVVVAPAGWGKTSLLSAWAAEPGDRRRVAWVSLDESDDEPIRFFSYVLTALRNASDQVSPAPLEALARSGLAPVDLALPMLLNELTASTVPHVLVLDDYHVLTDPRIHEAVEFLVAYLPASLRLVVAGRADPPLPLARLRARGDLTEVRAAELRFWPAEATALVSKVAGSEVSAAVAEAVWQRTEGWAAGLQLAALALRTGSARPGGDDRHLLDYFAAEVLPALAPRQRDLLVRAAPLELLSGPLCDAVLETTGSAEVLEELVRADLFVAALDDDGEWYRCHGLLRTALLREPGADPPGVLVRAARWFARQDRMDEAVRHLLLAGAHTEAEEMLVANAERFFFQRGAASTYLQLGEQLADKTLGPVLALSLATAGALAGRLDRVGHWVDVSEAALQSDTVMPGWHSARAAVLCLRATFGLADADSARAVELAQEAVDLETEPGARPHPTVRPALAAALVRDGRFAEGAAALLELWPRRGPEAWPPWIVLQVGGSLALSLVELGRGPEFDRVAREIAPVADLVQQEWDDLEAGVLAPVRLAEGRRRYQNGDAAGATVLLRRAVEIAELHPRPTILALSLVYLADAELGAGDRAAARDALVRAREVADEEPLAAYALDRLAEAETRMGRGAARAATRSGALMEEMTDRELSILRALQGSASQREIGAALFLSINTVKAYTKSLYRKLGVASRQDAVATGRQLGLI